MPTPAERNLAAYERAVAEGHRAFVRSIDSTRIGHRYVVEIVSHTTPGKHYEVRASASGGGHVYFSCLPVGPDAGVDDHQYIERSQPGIAPCKHAALAARRLSRDGIIVLG